MGLYQRYTSKEYDDEYFKRENEATEVISGELQLGPITGELGSITDSRRLMDKKIEEWISIFPRAAFFVGRDKELFEEVVIMVYDNKITSKISTLSFTKFGMSLYENLILDSKSRFWPSCENLAPEHFKSSVRRALAITNLKNYSKLANNLSENNLSKQWDETNAGNLASSMNLVTEKSPEELGQIILKLGLLQKHCILSILLDVIYEDIEHSEEKLLDDNNKLILELGEQQDQLFDPLLEYSPQMVETLYTVPLECEKPLLQNNENIDRVIEELLKVQTNYTLRLVNLLQNLIIPLRIHVLAIGGGRGIAKIGQLFPPTIDEVARMNCILHDALVKASKFGYVEIIRALAMILPYFYKPFVRHEANLKSFTPRLKKFDAKNGKKVFENKVINKKNFTVAEIESIVSGSLLELPKLKLILNRLYETIETEKRKFANFEEIPEEESETFLKYYDKAIEVIDAFGFVENTTKKNLESSNRVFTPAGKILAELATNWPKKLHYGWLSRKVVGIFELKNIKLMLAHPHDRDILIIFSDHLLILNIVEDDFYSSADSDTHNGILISDILMHSLMNEKPLPRFSLIPRMTVKYFCDINDVMITSYEANSKCSSHSQDFVQLLSLKESNPFDAVPDSSKSHTISINYELICEGNTKKNVNGDRVIELINKAKILNKIKPFHLFKSETPGLQVYATAQERSAYLGESSKFPIVLYLNINVEDMTKYFEDNPEVQVAFFATLINERQVQVIAYDKRLSLEMNEIVFIKDFRTYLKNTISLAYKLISANDKEMMRLNMKSYNDDVKSFFEWCMKAPRPDEDGITPHSVRTISNLSQHSLMKDATSVGDTRNSNYEEHDTERPRETPSTPEVPTCNHNAKKRKSVVLRVFRSIRRSLDGLEFILRPVKVEKLEDNDLAHPEIKDLPKSSEFHGKTKRYSKLYKPVPDLYSIESSKHKAPSHNNVEIPVDDPSKSRASSGSLDVKSNFHFPQNALEVEQVGTSGRKASNDLTQIIISNQKSESKLSLNTQTVPGTISTQPLKNSESHRMGFHSIVEISEGPCNDFPKKFHLGNFYDDGESNWIEIRRENSSLLNEEIRALKEEVEMDTAEVIDLQESFLRLASRIFCSNAPQPTQRKTSTDSALAHRNMHRDISQQSLTPSLAAELLGREIDINFSSLGQEEYEKPFKFTLSSKPLHVISEVNDRGMIETASSEEEYYSFDEHRNMMRCEANDDSILTTSSATIRDNNLGGKPLPKIPQDLDDSDSSSLFVDEKEESTLKHDPFRRRYESLTFVSGILNGAITID